VSSTFDELLRRQARQRGDALAVTDVHTTVTYAELDAMVSGYADQIAAGARPGERVAVIGDNSVSHLAAAFGVWRAGCTLVTIYASSTPQELDYAVGHSQPALVLHPVPGSVPDLDGGQARSCVAGQAPIALICYTSGSTSRPKAVMHSHAGLAGAALAYADVWHLGPDDVTLVSLPLAWAFGLVTTSMATLSAGGHVVLLARSDPASLLRSLAGHGATFFAGVTTIFVKMLAAIDDDPSLPLPSDLRLCISGGEPRNEHAFDRWTAITGCPVHDVYAASECFPVVTYDPILDPRPIAGVAGRVVPDAAVRLVEGEAWTRGPALMLGYWGDPELTKAALTDDGWYRTGDLVEIDDAGYVRVVGRLSDLIIRGGANVSPAEVEAVLLTHPGVREAAVVGLADATYGEQVVAAVVLDPGTADVTTEQLAEHCTVLASYKRPTRFVVVEQLPRNANTGKVQRRELAAQLAAGGTEP
jgi:long-chain acyl-CoA synthetase